MPPSHATQLSLISRIKREDGSAWAELVGLYSPLVAFWCRRLGVREQEIQDLSQEIFFAVSRSLSMYHPTGRSGSFRGWLWSLTRHKAIDFFRRSQRVPLAQGGSSALQLAENTPEAPDESDDSEQMEHRSLVQRALSQVRSEFESRSWQAFWRTAVDNISIEQVAVELQMSKATIRQHRSRILRRLRQQLGDMD